MFNPIDVPTAGMYCAALYYLARIAGALGSARLSDWLRFGLFAGLTLGVRMVGILLVPYAGLSIAAWALLALRSRRADLYRHGPRIVAGFLLATAATIAVSFALWPRMLVEPLTGLADSLVRTQDYPWTGDVLFRGEYYSANALPPSYLAVWFGITTPIATMLGLALALALRARWLPLESAALLRAGIVLFAVLFPPTYATLSHATLYDGIRHFLFVLPPLAALAGCGWGALFAVAAAWRRRAVRAGAVALVAAVAEPLVWYARSYPHAYVYFNPLAGGIARASHRYETDYWALTIREAAEWMVAHRREIVGSDAPMRVVTSSSWHLFSPWLDDSSKYVEVQNDEPFHVGVVHTRFQPLGWAERARPTRHKVIAEGQVPFWQLFVGPLSKAARPRERR